MGGRVAWIGQTKSYFILLRVSELFPENDGRMHAVYCLRGGDVGFWADECQWQRENSPEMDALE